MLASSLDGRSLGRSLIVTDHETTSTLRSVGLVSRQTKRTMVGGVAQWLGRWSLAGGLSLIHA